jgi:hypothetical protein
MAALNLESQEEGGGCPRQARDQRVRPRACGENLKTTKHHNDDMRVGYVESGCIFEY